MKKILFFMMSVLLMMSCGESASVNGGEGNENGGVQPTETRATQVFMQGKDLSAGYTRAMAVNTEDAYFFVRIDNSAPGFDKLPTSNNYWPQDTKGGSVFADGNKGLVDLDYPYFKTTTNYSKYVYDTKGETTVDALASVPSMEDIIKANQNPALNLSGVNSDDYKIIWYVVKFSMGKWHVDGVLTKKTTTDASDVLPDLDEENKDLENSADMPALPSKPEYGNGNVEVNIHQQEHSTWDEIKTSIHVRDLVDEVKVEIPIGFDNVAESDDFAIRTYDYALESKVFINGAEYALNDATNPIRISVEHQATKVVITISAISHDYIKALREAYGDGITVEVHTYPKNMTNADVWSAIKQSTVTVVPSSYSNILKSTTSAFFDN